MNKAPKNAGAKYKISPEEEAILKDGLLQYFAQDDQRSRRRVEITRRTMEKLRRFGDHWAKQRTVRLWFNNNLKNYMPNAKREDGDDETPSQGTPRTALTPASIECPVPPTLDQLPTNSFENFNQGSNYFTNESTFSTPSQPPLSQDSNQHSQVFSSQENSLNIPRNTNGIAFPSIQFSPGDSGIVSRQPSLTGYSPLPFSPLDALDITSPSINLSSEIGQNAPNAIPPLHPQVPQLSPVNEPSLVKVIQPTTVKPVQQKQNDLQLRNEPAAQIDQKLQSEPVFTQATPTEAPQEIIIDLEKPAQPKETFEAPVEPEQIKPIETNVNREKDQKNEIGSQKLMKRNEMIKVKRQLINKINDIVKRSVTIAQSEEDRLKKQIALSDEMESIRRMAYNDLIYSEGKIPARTADLPEIKAVGVTEVQRIYSTVTGQIINEDGIKPCDSTSLPETPVNPTLPQPIPFSYTQEQIDFIKGNCKLTTLSEKNIELIAPYNKGVIYVKYENNYSSIVKASVENGTKDVLFTTKTGFFTHVIALKVIEKLNSVFVIGDKRVKSFSLDDLSVLKVYNLEEVYNCALIDFFDDKLIIAASKALNCDIVMFDINASEPRESVTIDKDLAIRENMSLNYVTGGAGANPCSTMEMEEPISAMCTVGNHLVISYREKACACVYDNNFVETARLVGHSEDIIGLTAIDDETVLTSSNDITCRKWSVLTGELLCNYTSLGSPAASTYYSLVRGIPTLFIATSNGRVRCFDMSLNEQAFVIRSDSGKFDFVSCNDNMIMMDQPVGDAQSRTKVHKITLARFDCPV